LSGKVWWARVVTAAAVAVCGCAVGPDFQRPRAPDVAGYTAEPPAPTAAAETRGGQGQRFVRELDIPGQWWTLFRCEALNRLIEQALEDNPDVGAAQAALRQANEEVHAREGALLPSADAGVQACLLYTSRCV